MKSDVLSTGDSRIVIDEMPEAEKSVLTVGPLNVIAVFEIKDITELMLNVFESMGGCVRERSFVLYANNPCVVETVVVVIDVVVEAVAVVVEVVVVEVVVVVGVVDKIVVVIVVMGPASTEVVEMDEERGVESGTKTNEH
jgi:hypothetical protein